jgi:hypothetical protein
VQFFEPAGVAVGSDAAGRTELLVADTNNHRVVTVDPASGRWREVVFDGLTAPETKEVAADGAALDGGTAQVAAGEGLTVEIEPAIPAGAHLTPQAPMSVRVTAGARVVYAGTMDDARGVPLRYELPAEALREQPGAVRVTLYYSYCIEGGAGGGSVCVPAEARWDVRVTYGGAGAPILRLVEGGK